MKRTCSDGAMNSSTSRALMPPHRITKVRPKAMRTQTPPTMAHGDDGPAVHSQQLGPVQPARQLVHCVLLPPLLGPHNPL
jgi:hypothetical protein